MNERLHIISQHLLPQHLCSRLMGFFTDSKISWLKNWMIKKFIKKYEVNLEEAQRQSPEQYQSFNDFFTRKLDTNARIIDKNTNSIISPVDGCISQVGAIKQQSIIHAKGKNFSLESLLAHNLENIKLFENGSFATLYLAPKDYHRIHMPVDGKLQSMQYVPGKLFSVNHSTAAEIDNLFARNERVINIFETDHGPMAVIMVGAFFVASIHTAWAGEVAPGKLTQPIVYQNPIEFCKGDDIGHFQLGSTVVLLFAENQIKWQENLKSLDTIQMGQALAQKTI